MKEIQNFQQLRVGYRKSIRLRLSRSSLINPKMAVLALKDAVPRVEMINKLEGVKLIDVCKAILLMDSPSIQREAAIILATYDIGRDSDEWQSILGVAITALDKLKDKDVI